MNEMPDSLPVEIRQAINETVAPKRGVPKSVSGRGLLFLQEPLECLGHQGTKGLPARSRYSLRLSEQYVGDLERRAHVL